MKLPDFALSMNTMKLHDFALMSYHHVKDYRFKGGYSEGLVGSGVLGSFGNSLFGEWLEFGDTHEQVDYSVTSDPKQNLWVFKVRRTICIKC